MKKHPSTNRCRELTAKEARELTMPPEFLAAANAEHDRKYGLDYMRVGWRSFFEPASPNKSPEAIWSWHRQIEAAKKSSLSI